MQLVFGSLLPLLAQRCACLNGGADSLNSPVLDPDLLVSDEAFGALARLMKDKQGSIFEPLEPDQPDDSLELAL